MVFKDGALEILRLVIAPIDRAAVGELVRDGVAEARQTAITPPVVEERATERVPGLLNENRLGRGRGARRARQREKRCEEGEEGDKEPNPPESTPVRRGERSSLRGAVICGSQC